MPQRGELQIMTLCHQDGCTRKQGGSEDGMDSDRVLVKYDRRGHGYKQTLTKSLPVPYLHREGKENKVRSHLGTLCNCTHMCCESVL